MKFPVNSLLAGNFGAFRDGFARDSLLLRGVECEPDFYRRLVGLTRDRAADFFGKSTYLRGCGGHTGVFDDAKPQRHRLLSAVVYLSQGAYSLR